MGDYLKASRRQISLEVMSQKEAQQQNLNRTLEQMQNKFFVQQPAPANNEAEMAATDAPVDELKHTDFTSMKSKDGLQSQGRISVAGLGLTRTASVPAPSVPAPSVPVSSVATTPPAAPAPVMSAASEAPAPTILEAAPSTDLTSQAIPQVVESVVSVTPKAAPPKLNAGVDGTLSSVGPATADTMTVEGGDDFNSEGGNLSQGEDGFQNLQAQTSADRGHLTQLKGESFIIQTQPTPEQQTANVKELVSKAQFMAQKGGGEMKVTLTPEGLGEVNMKVMVQNGHVNVEMITESSEAKKILEKGLGDLKANLISHNLRIDQVKVDTAADVSRQLTQQHDEAQRQFAQQFMEQFRQDNNEWRRGFYDIAGAKVYRSQKDQANDNATRIGEAEARRRQQGRRLDLVA